MKLRDLEYKDAPFMLEWMHDKSVTCKLQTNFAEKTLEDCKAFIESANNKINNLHMAIVDVMDKYMGTVSLKNITKVCAEFAITIRKEAMGKGYSQYGMKEIIRIGFDDMELENIYWCVAPDNNRAIHFYDKNGYHKMTRNGFWQFLDMYMCGVGYTIQQTNSYIWYLETKKGSMERNLFYS